MKILFWGIGSIGKRHAEIILKNYSDISLYALRSKKSVNNNFQDDDFIENIYNVEEAFSINPDVVFITNPTSMHVKSALTAAEHGCHIFMEKPISNKLDNIERLLAIIDEKEIITLMGCNMRFNPVILKIKEYVNNFKLGKVLSFNVFCGSYLPEWRPWQDYSKSYSASKELGGGVVLDLIHEIDYTRWIFGDFKEIKSTIGKASNLEIETEDFADILITTENNIGGSMHLDYFSRQPRRRVEVIFEKGYICGDLINNSIIINDAIAEENMKYNIERNYTYEEQLKYLMHCIKENKNTFNTMHHGYEILKIAMKIKEGGNI